MSEGPTVAVAELLGHVIMDVLLAERAHAQVDVGVRILGEHPLRGQDNKDESTDRSGMVAASAGPIPISAFLAKWKHAKSKAYELESGPWVDNFSVCMSETKNVSEFSPGAVAETSGR